MYSYLDGAYAVVMQRITNDLEQERLIQARRDRLNQTSFDQSGIQ